MYNSKSAVERIKNSLSYKLGSAILEYKKQYKRDFFLTLIYNLYKIKKQHVRDQKLYKQVTKIFPQFKYPKLETCSDYNESIKYKYHLSYMLGEILIHAHKTWYKGGYFKLYKNIQTVKKQYNLLKELSLNNIDISLENKELLMDNFDAMKDILQTHKDYKPILENIFYNFKFFLANLTLIKEWLLSDDFYSRYKDENHPYPSLLDPKKLNTDSEEINYKNISVELAWRMNLPLPDNYEFIWFASALSGHAAMTIYLELCDVNICKCLHHDPYIIYSNILTQLLNSSSRYNIVAYTDYTHIYISRQDLGRFLSLLDKNKPVLYLVRDPISRLKTGLNHINLKTDRLDYFDLNTPIEKVLDRETYFFGSSMPTCEHIKTYWIYAESFLRLNFLTQFFKIEKITYLDMNSIKSEYIYHTFSKLHILYRFRKMSKDLFYDTAAVYDMLGTFLSIPLTLCINLIDFKTENKTIEILITTRQLLKLHKITNYKEVNFIFFKNELPFENLIFCVPDKKFIYFKNNLTLIERIRPYLEDFISKLKIKFDSKSKYLINENKILLYFKDNKNLMKQWKRIFDQELVCIKQHRPDIVASWKYYQEFEKMCEELDKKE